MTRPPIDPRIRQWLDSGATRAPDELVEMVLAEFPSVARRRGWRALGFLRLPGNWRDAIGVTLIVVLISSGAAIWIAQDEASHAGAPVPLSSGPPSLLATPVPALPSATLLPEATGSPTAFTSRAFAYRLAVPSDWSVSLGAGGWKGGVPTLLNRLGLDRFSGTRGYVLIGSRPLAAAKSLDAWTASVVADSRSLGSYHWTAPERITLANATADLVAVTCSNCDEYYLLIMAVHEGNGWYLYWSSPTANQPASDRATFLTLLDTFAFTN